MKNASLSLDNEKIFKAFQNFQLFPNGIFKTIMRFHDKKDENIATFVYFNEFYTRDNHLTGYDTM
jgi:hypothetical protein